MSTKLKRIIFIYLLLVLILAIIPYFIFADKKFEKSLDLIRTMSILATSLFALIYFDPFGIKKKNVEKQYDNVIKILELFVGQRLTLVCIFDEQTSGEKSIGSLFINKLTISRYKSTNRPTAEGKNLSLYIPLHNFIESQKKLVELKNHLWTPKEIFEKMQFLEFVQSKTTPVLRSPYAILYWNSTNNEDKSHYHFDFNPKEGELYATSLNGSSYTLFTFLLEYDRLISACETWLQKNSFSSESLNI